jgi:hypothetical protein
MELSASLLLAPSFAIATEGKAVADWRSLVLGRQSLTADALNVGRGWHRTCNGVLELAHSGSERTSHLRQALRAEEEDEQQEEHEDVRWTFKSREHAGSFRRRVLKLEW